MSVAQVVHVLQRGDSRVAKGPGQGQWQGPHRLHECIAHVSS